MHECITLHKYLYNCGNHIYSCTLPVNWSSPSDRAATITAYRIFYVNGESVLVPSTITGIILSLNEDSVSQTESLHSEAQIS